MQWLTFAPDMRNSPTQKIRRHVDPVLIVANVHFSRWTWRSTMLVPDG